MHPNADRAQRFIDAYSRGDLDVAAQHLAEDIVWHVGGEHRWSGNIRGREAVLDYFRTIQRETGGTLQINPTHILANDRRGAIFMRVTGTRGDRNLDVRMAEVFETDDEGRWTEYWAAADDQAAVDAFWS